MNEKRFEDDGVECINNYNYALLDTYYEFDGKRIIEWNKHSSNAEYTDFKRIAEILNIKQMRLESLMKHREEVGKLLNRIDEQQATIEQLNLAIDDLLSHTSCDEIKKENEQLHHELQQTKEYLQIKIDECKNYKKMKEIVFGVEQAVGYEKALLQFQKGLKRRLNNE